MKNPTKTSEAWMSGVKLGIVRLGRAGGKMKYTLLDERDITLVQEFAFEARVEIDKNGSGANIYAFAYDVTRGRNCGQYVHDLLWERHYGGIALGFRVAHKNGITMDNRLENLCLVPQCYQGSLCAEVQAKREQTLYWAAIQELPPDHLVEEVFQHVLVKKHFTESGNPRRFNANGELIEEEEDVACYYECHYLPCTNIEQEPREFSICGRCQEARYCGPLCQQRDWPIHKKFCREKLRPVLRERPPER